MLLHLHPFLSAASDIQQELDLDPTDLSEIAEFKNEFQMTDGNNHQLLFVSIFIIVVLIVVFVWKHLRRTKKQKRTIVQEIKGYMSGPTERYIYSGNITFRLNRFTYTRGNRSMEIDVPLNGKQVYLAPLMVDEWFAQKAYNQGEAIRILEDLQHFIQEHKLSKQVTLVTDDEYESLFEEAFGGDEEED